MHGDETIGRCHDVERPRVTKEKEPRESSVCYRKICASYRLNRHPNTIQVLLKCFGAHSLDGTVKYGNTQQTFHLCVSVDQTSASSTPTLGSGTSWLGHRSLEENCLVERITIHRSARLWTGQSTPSHRKAVTLSYTADYTQACGEDIMLWGTFSLVSLGSEVVVEQNMKAADYTSLRICCTLICYLLSQM